MARCVIYRSAKKLGSYAHGFRAEYQARHLDARINDILMTWLFRTSCQQTAGSLMPVTFDWQGLYRSKAQFLLVLKSKLVWVWEQNTWKSQISTMQQSTDQARLTCNLCYEPLMILSRIRPRPLRSTLCHSTNVGITFVGLLTGSSFACQMFRLSFPEFLEVEAPNTPSRSISMRVQISNTMRAFDYNPHDTAGSYIARAITPKCCLLSEVSKTF